jgi:hypothetical protein
MHLADIHPHSRPSSVDATILDEMVLPANA